MVENLKKNKFEYIVLLTAILLSFSWSIFNLNNFDKTKINHLGNWYNQLLNYDLKANWVAADKFKIKLDKNEGFFYSLPAYEKYFLPTVMVGYYYHLIDKDIFEIKDNGQKVIKVKNYKFNLLIFQIIFFYLSVLLFAQQLKKKINKNLYRLIVILLCLEPSILQWHSSLWTESIFLSMMLILFSLILRKSDNILINLFTGIVVGIMYTQRAVSFLYIIPILIYYLIIYQKKILPYIFLLIGYLFIILSIGYNNYKKTDHFHILSKVHQYYSYSHYFAHEIYADRKNISKEEAKKILFEKEKKWMTENNININKFDDLIKGIDYRNKIFVKELIENPIFLIEKFTKRIILMCIIHPIWTHEHYFVDKHHPQAKNDPKEYYHKNILKDIIYSIFIYIFTFIGIFKFSKKFFSKTRLDDFDNFLIFNIFSIFYFIGVAGLWGNPKYFAPCMISVIFFFSIGFEKVKKDLFDKKIN